MNSWLVTGLLSHLSGERPPGRVHETTLRGTGRALTQKDAGVRVDGPRTYCGRQSPNGGYISTCVLFWPEACISPSFLGVAIVAILYLEGGLFPCSFLLF